MTNVVLDERRLDLYERILDCKACDLRAGCSGPVPFTGKTPSRIAIIGEAPGQQEDADGVPFIGPSGQLLRQTLAANKVNIDAVAIFNTVSCFPKGTPEGPQIKACRQNLLDQLELANPQFVLLLGKVAMRAWLPRAEMKHSRRHPFSVGERVFFGAYHPSAALRNAKVEQAFTEDIKIFCKMAKHCISHAKEFGNGLSPFQEGEWRIWTLAECVICGRDACWWGDNGLPWCDQCMPEDVLAQYKAQQTKIQMDYQVARINHNVDKKMAESMAAVEAAADPEWMDKAWRTLVTYLETHVEFFVDSFWEETGLERPKESRALGPLVLRAAKQGLMEKSGEFRKSVSSNQTEKPIWRSLVNGGRQ